MMKSALLSAAGLVAVSALDSDTCQRACYHGSPTPNGGDFPDASPSNTNYCQDAIGICQFPQAVTAGYEPESTFDCPTDCEFKSGNGECWENPESEEQPVDGKCFCKVPEVYDFCAAEELKKAQAKPPCGQTCYFGSPTGIGYDYPQEASNAGFCQDAIGICQYPQATTAGYQPDDSFDCPTECEFKNPETGECWENPGSEERPVDGKCFCKSAEVYDFCAAEELKVLKAPCAQTCYFGSPTGIGYEWPQVSSNAGFCQDAIGICQYPQATTAGYQPDDSFDCPTECEFKNPETGECWENPGSEERPVDGKCFCKSAEVYDFCAPSSVM
jgi:hypothetical protein